MTRKASTSVVLLIVLFLVSLCLAGGIFYLFQKERAENLKLQEQVEDIKVNLEKTKVELASSKKEISAFELRLKDAQTQIDTLNSDLQQEKASKQEALQQIEAMRVDLEQQKALRLDLEKRFSQAQDEVKRTQAQLKVLESRKMDLEAKISELETKSQNLETKVQGIELGKIVVSSETPAPKPQLVTKPISGKQEKVTFTSGTEGKILVVNKDYNFAVINLGSKDGVGIGDVFSVYHNNRYLGDIKIEKLHDSMAAAGFVSPDIKDKASEGDKVVLKTK